MNSIQTSAWRRFTQRPGIRRLRGLFWIFDDIGGRAVGPLARRLAHPAVIITLVLSVSLGTLVRVATEHHPLDASHPQVFGIGGDGTIQTTATQQITVAKLKHLENADILLTSPKPLSDDQIARARSFAGNGNALVFSIGRVILGRGTTEAIGIDPSTFRPFAPESTAESDPLWQVVAQGDVAVAHTVARALAVPLGGVAVIAHNRARMEQFHVGAYATTGIPGIGVVVNHARGRQLGLTERTGLLLSTKGVDPIVATAAVRTALPSMAVALVHIPTDTNGKLQWVAPAFGRLTSGFGPRDGRFHEGLDFGANYGAPVYAAADGYVLYAGPASGFGNEVVLQHANGVVTVYGHMERILIGSGFVRAGKAIALVGSEGDSTGPHLHFEVHLNDRPIDPYIWLRDHGVRFS